MSAHSRGSNCKTASGDTVALRDEMANQRPRLEPLLLRLVDLVFPRDLHAVCPHVWSPKSGPCSCSTSGEIGPLAAGKSPPFLYTTRHPARVSACIIAKKICEATSRPPPRPADRAQAMRPRGTRHASCFRISAPQPVNCSRPSPSAISQACPPPLVEKHLFNPPRSRTSRGAVTCPRSAFQIQVDSPRHHDFSGPA